MLSDVSFREILNAAPDAIVIVSESGEIVYANTQVVTLFGYSRDEILGESIELLLPNRYRNHHRCCRDGFFRNPQARPMGSGLTLYGLRKDGSEFPIDISLNFVKTEAGILAASAIRDLSDRLLQSEQQFRAVFQQRHQLCGIIDLEGRLIHANDRSIEFSALTRDSVIGKYFWDAGWWTHDPNLQKQLREAINRGINGETVKFEATHPRPNGTLATIDFSIRPVQNSRGEVVFLVSESVDISSRKQAEHKLRQSHEQLEARVLQRTEALAHTNEQLRQSTKIAETATATKTRFLNAASHDLKQPLAAIDMYLSSLDSHKKNTRDIATKIRTTVTMMRELLNALLDLTKLDSGIIQPKRSKLSLEKLIKCVVANTEADAKKKGLILSYSKTLCTIYSDPVLLQRIIENFVNNAIRYTEIGQIDISCECVGNIARIAVSDTGVGIPEEDMNMIFEEYFQSDNGGDAHLNGSGLGLSIAKHIAQLLDHEISVSSIVGKGSTFCIEAPIHN